MQFFTDKMCEKRRCFHNEKPLAPAIFGLTKSKQIVYNTTKGVNMAQKISMLNKVDNKLVGKYKDMSIQHRIATKLDFTINIAGTDFNNIEEALIFAYRCGLAFANSDQSKKNKDTGSGGVDQDELYRVLRKGQSIEHKADFLREIDKEWFPIELHSEKKIKTVHIELNELADFLEK
jgi:hypothetical protein